MSDDLRARIRAALLAVNHPYGPDELARIPDSQGVAGRVGDLADAVMAVLDEAFPPRQFLDPAPQMRPEDVAAWYVAWAEALDGDARMRVTVLPPNAVAIYRRTPEQRRTYLAEHRGEALANGIPEDLIDMLIADAEISADDIDPDVCADCCGVGYDIGGPEQCTTCEGSGLPPRRAGGAR